MFTKWCMAKLLQILLRIRYRIRIHGIEKLLEAKKRGNGVLILPNHPAAVVDPMLVMTTVGGLLPVHSLVVNHYYYSPIIHRFLKFLDCIPIPDFDLAVNEWKLKQVDLAYRKMHAVLKKQEAVLIYPAGTVKKGAKEHLAGKSLVHRLLVENPNAEVILVRITGLWGSSFSKAFGFEAPNLGTAFLRGLKIALKNGIFFVPKREITIEIENLPSTFNYQASKVEMNLFFEDWYNRYPTKQGRVSEEPLQLVPDYFYSKKVPYPTLSKKREESEGEIEVPPSVRELILHKLSLIARRPIAQIRDSDDLSSELGCDSLDLANLISFLDQEFGIDRKISSLDTEKVSDLYLIALRKKVPKNQWKESATVTRGWNKESRKRPFPFKLLGKTIPEAFLERAAVMGSFDAVADEGTLLRYKKMRQSVVVLARRLQRLQGRYVGVLLPTSVGAMIVILALQLAGKIPVIINFTAGSRAINHIIRSLSIQQVISARRFLDRVPNLELGLLDETLILAEDIKKQIGLKERLIGGLLGLRSTRFLLNHFGLGGLSEEMPAVVLMTSGTENYPKSVLLSHKNILSNIEGFSEVLQGIPDMSFFSPLPFFHSFGLNPLGFYPLLTGVPAFFSPDPTDAYRMAIESSYWKPKLIALTPSFYANFLQIAKPEQISSYQVMVSGAEKASEDLRREIEKRGFLFLEGYGVTEASPVVAVHRIGRPPVGVGLPLANVEVRVLDETQQHFLPPGKEGEILIRGPSVFKGYAEKEVKSPFLFVNGLCYYRTGDYGYIDDQQNLILKGRLKRFVKVGGEMISLPMIEQQLLLISKKEAWGTIKEGQAAFCVVPVEEGQGRMQLVLFCPFDLTPTQVNQALYREGLPKLVKISFVEKMRSLPLLGSGKINFKALADLAVAKVASS